MPEKSGEIDPEVFKAVVEAQIETMGVLDSLTPPSYNPRQYGFSLTQFEAPVRFTLIIMSALVSSMAYWDIFKGGDLGSLYAMIVGAGLGAGLGEKMFRDIRNKKDQH